MRAMQILEFGIENFKSVIGGGAQFNSAATR